MEKWISNHVTRWYTRFLQIISRVILLPKVRKSVFQKKTTYEILDAHRR